MSIYNAVIQIIDNQETKRYAGLPKATFDDKLIQEACELALLLINPKCSWNVYNYDKANGIVQSPVPLILKGNKIVHHLNDCAKVAVIAATIGKEIELESNRLFAKDKYALGTILDAAGTAAVEQTADQLETIIYNEVKKRGLSLKWRFSPGYGDWPIQQQPEILRLSDAKRIGISITDGMMLTPQKSITAIIGIYENNGKCFTNSNVNHNCAECNKINCPARIQKNII